LVEGEAVSEGFELVADTLDTPGGSMIDGLIPETGSTTTITPCSPQSMQMHTGAA
jgi:hypothetical protein